MTSLFCQTEPDQIDALTIYRLSQTGVDAYPLRIQGFIKKAICAQTQYLDANGGIDALADSDFASMGLGKFNYSGNPGTSAGEVQYSPLVFSYLFPTGLLYRGIDRR